MKQQVDFGGLHLVRHHKLMQSVPGISAVFLTMTLRRRAFPFLQVSLLLLLKVVDCRDCTLAGQLSHEGALIAEA